MKKEDQIRKNKIIEYINSKEYTKMTAKQIAVIFAIPKDEYKEYEKKNFSDEHSLRYDNGNYINRIINTKK